MQFSISESRSRRGAGMWLRTIAVAGFAILMIAIAAPRAHATCGELTGAHPTIVRPPMIAAEAGDLQDGRGYDSFVGVWQTVYTSGGAVFFESFKQWHADGTELDSADLDPEIGNFCVGVWKAVDGRTVRVHHVGWVFATDGTPEGSFTIDETDKLAIGGMSYKGSFVYKTFDTNGNYNGTTVTGTVAASRITVN